MNDETLRRRISAIAAESWASESPRVVVTDHAKAQMKRRSIQPKQMYDVLIRGRVIEPAHRDIHGCWKCTLEYLTAGERVKVPAALCQAESHEIVVVITVIN
jgi:hypothetical protein